MNKSEKAVSLNRKSRHKEKVFLCLSFAKNEKSKICKNEQAGFWTWSEILSLSLSFTLTCTFTRVRFAHLNKLTLSLPLSLKGQWRLLPTPEIRSSNPVIGKSYLQSNNLKLYWKDENSTVHPRLVTLYLNQMGLQCYFPLAKCGSTFISQFYKQPTIVNYNCWVVIQVIF